MSWTEPSGPGPVAYAAPFSVTTSDPALYEKLVDYRVHGMRPRYYHHAVGGNFRIDALQAAILRIKLRHLDSWHDGRRQNACTYYELFDTAGVFSDTFISETPFGLATSDTFGLFVNDHVLAAGDDAGETPAG